MRNLMLTTGLALVGAGAAFRVSLASEDDFSRLTVRGGTTQNKECLNSPYANCTTFVRNELGCNPRTVCSQADPCPGISGVKCLLEDCERTGDIITAKACMNAAEQTCNDDGTYVCGDYKQGSCTFQTGVPGIACQLTQNPPVWGILYLCNPICGGTSTKTACDVKSCP